MNTKTSVAPSDLETMRIEAMNRWHAALERLSSQSGREREIAVEAIRVARYTFQAVNLMYLMAQRQAAASRPRTESARRPKTAVQTRKTARC